MRRLLRYQVLPSLRAPLGSLQLALVLLAFMLQFGIPDPVVSRLIRSTLLGISLIVALMTWLGLHRYPLGVRLLDRYEAGDDLWRNIQHRRQQEIIDWFYEIYSILMYNRPQFAPFLREQTKLGWEEWTEQQRDHKELAAQVRAVQEVLAKEIMPRL